MSKYFFGNQKKAKKQKNKLKKGRKAQEPPCQYDDTDDSQSVLKRQLQESMQALRARETQKERLASRESFLNTILNVIKSVNIYTKAYLDKKPQETMETINIGMNLQIMFLKAGVKEKIGSEKEWDHDTLKMGRVIADEFADQVLARKMEAGKTHSKRVRGAIKRMETYAGAIQTALVDPSKVAQPRVAKYEGPSGEEVDRWVAEQGDKAQTGFSTYVHANHEKDEMIKEIDQNPEKFDKKHREILERRMKGKKRTKEVDYIPSNSFNFDIHEDRLEKPAQDAPPDLQKGFDSMDVDVDLHPDMDIRDFQTKSSPPHSNQCMCAAHQHDCRHEAGTQAPSIPSSFQSTTKSSDWQNPSFY